MATSSYYPRAADTAGRITRADRENLLKVARMRARVAKTDAEAVAARRKAEFEAQLATKYSFDTDEVWKEAVEIAAAAAREANDIIARRCAEKGIPKIFAPSLSSPGWYDRGENAVRDRRAELTRVAHTKIEELKKHAKAEIERTSAKVQTQLLADGLESAQAKAFLEAMPTAEQLMPAVTLSEVQVLLPRFADEG